MAAFTSISIHRLFSKRPREATLTATDTQTAGLPSFQILNCTAARTVLMPAVADVTNKIWLIHNRGSAALTIQTSTGGAIITLQAGKGVMLGVFSSAWRILLKGATA